MARTLSPGSPPSVSSPWHSNHRHVPVRFLDCDTLRLISAGLTRCGAQARKDLSPQAQTRAPGLIRSFCLRVPILAAVFLFGLWQYVSINYIMASFLASHLSRVCPPRLHREQGYTKHRALWVRRNLNGGKSETCMNVSPSRPAGNRGAKISNCHACRRCTMGTFMRWESEIYRGCDVPDVVC
ncbi:hypothetical protein A0H81_03346 [Grifola frondosa]|uniref:Uncharacterized protein n=1 Tax=Grifola frondosa TaxID=5627 RepID=A0A1C7MP70_GRIFR|nr:hypothetical protein A0H81_03346 [Grifola frondosa]